MDLKTMTLDQLKCLVYDLSIELNKKGLESEEIKNKIISLNDEVILRGKNEGSQS